MKKLRNSRFFVPILVSIMGGFFLWSCEDEITPPPVPPLIYSLDIFLLNGNPEVFVDSSTRIGGYLTGVNHDTLSGEKIYFTVSPSSAGNISPNIGAFTDPSESDGFTGSVIFVARNPSNATIYGRYRDQEGATVASDTIGLRIRHFGNE